MLIRRTSQGQRAAKRKGLPVAELAARYAAGETVAELADAFGVVKATIRARLREAAITMRPAHTRRKVLPMEDIIARHDMGESLGALAAAYGVSKSVIHRRLREAHRRLREDVKRKGVSWTPPPESFIVIDSVIEPIELRMELNRPESHKPFFFDFDRIGPIAIDPTDNDE